LKIAPLLRVPGGSVAMRIEKAALAYCAAENCEYPTSASF
jgi:hypothetical protein